MLLEILGRTVSRHPLAVVAGWLALLGAMLFAAPPWESVVEEGQFEFLPRSAPSRQAERLLNRAWPDRRADSSLVILIRRTGEEAQLGEPDRDFIRETFVPSLESIDTPQWSDENSQTRPLVTDILTAGTSGGELETLLDSRDGQATLVVVELTTEFLHERVKLYVDRVEETLDRLRSKGNVPDGLELAMTGSAAVGRDDLRAREESGRRIQSWTRWLVISLLLIVFRAPIAAVIPLATLYCGITVAFKSLALLASGGYVDLFEGIEVYTTVLVYGAGVDYGMFLISRYQEELGVRGDPQEAVAVAIRRVGVAVAASAGTEIFGIGMLVFAAFGKFHQAGITIATGLFVMLCASLTLTPALLCVAGNWTFWPRKPMADPDDSPQNPSDRLWNRIGRTVVARPGLVWSLTLVVLAAPAAYGVIRNNDLSYGLIENLPNEAPSVRGARLLTEHYSAGRTGPITVLLHAPDVDFTRSASINAVDQLTARLADRRDELGIAEIRSVAEPLGLGGEEAPSGGALNLVQRRIARHEAVERYVSSKENHATQIQVVMNNDPLSRHAIPQLNEIRNAVRSELPRTLQNADVLFAGATAGIRDLKSVAERDRRLIQPLVAGGVLMVLIVMLRRLVASIYLVLTVLLTYFGTIGTTFALFAFLANGEFPGLHWTVPLFLFAVLMAVGADYNVLLIKRVDEERHRAETGSAIITALGRTGAVISSCGFIMAGTFSSLAFGGTVAGMTQLGFALAFGIFLDTFVVRPLLVPAFLAMWYESRWHRCGRTVVQRLAASVRANRHSVGDAPRR